MKLKTTYTTLRFIFGDQLHSQHSWFSKKDPSVLYVIAELGQEATYVKHHLQKICAFFAAMQAFAEALEQKGHHVLYLTLDDTVEHRDLNQMIAALVKQYSVDNFHYQYPDEYRLLQQLRSIKLPQRVTVREFESEHFFLAQQHIADYVQPAQHNRMEFFYRKLRKQFDVLMEGGQPLGGKWNYDAENRQKIKAQDLEKIPQSLQFNNDVSGIIARLKRHNIPYFGACDEHLLWPVTRDQSLKLLRHFCRECLAFFGQFQDAMTCQHREQWTLFHSRLAFSLNSKLLQPSEVIAAAIDTYETAKGKISLPQVEGFVRQILGWREYIRAVYWINMPDYASRNALRARRNLPEYFWHAKTNMQCMKQAITQSLQYAYAHHIQRLMVTGNFCLLTGVHPDQVDKWYLGVYVDAIEWVEMPNTRGMSQFADGGWVATKPYAAGGNYINKMSDYCKQCHYKVKEKVGEDACPFNSLYWHFMQRHRQKLEKNPRIGMIYKSWDKQGAEAQKAILSRADWCLQNIEKL